MTKPATTHASPLAGAVEQLIKRKSENVFNCRVNHSQVRGTTTTATTTIAAIRFHIFRVYETDASEKIKMKNKKKTEMRAPRSRLPTSSEARHVFVVFSVVFSFVRSSS